MKKRTKMLRLSTNKVFLGVVGGFGNFLGIDSTLLRVLFAAAVLLTGFFPGVVLYFLAWFIMRAAEADDGVIEVKARPKKK